MVESTIIEWFETIGDAYILIRKKFHTHCSFPAQDKGIKYRQFLMNGLASNPYLFTYKIILESIQSLVLLKYGQIRSILANISNTHS